jgi:predicted O-linked N-acetylglucosamine transferase (SPINDLY family)
MSKQGVEQAMRTAVAHHQAGRFAQAEPIYRQVLAVEPDMAEALHLLGVLSGQTGRHAAAADLIRQAIVRSPRNPAYHCNLGYSLLQMSQLEAAYEAFRAAIALGTDNPEAYFFVGNDHLIKGEIQPAIAFYQRALSHRPNYVDALNNLGHALVTNNQHVQAIAVCRRAIALDSGNAGAHNNLGNACKGNGDIQEAIASYRRALALAPNYADAHNNLGNALQDTREFDLAIASYQTAISLNPNYFEFHSNLAGALLGKKQWDQAIAAAQHSICLNPAYPKAHYNLANAFKGRKQLPKAIASMESAISLQPDYVDALLGLALLHVEEGNPKKGMEHVERALAIKPDSADVYNVMGIIQCGSGELDKAIENHRRALQLKPDSLEAHHNLGNAFKEKGMLDEAVRSYMTALKLDPNHVKVLCGLGGAWKEGAQLDLALECYKKARAIDEDDTDAIAGIASTCQDMGRLENAIKCYRRVLELDPSRKDTHQGLLFSLLYHEVDDPLVTTEEHRKWGLRHAEPFSQFIKPLTNDLNPNRKLRIGYVSGDFRRHSVMHFFEPLLRAHDKSLFDIYCYANVRKTDAVTERLKAHATQWRDIWNMNDDLAAALVRDDKIDILVELGGHTADQRLLLFARRPAPVQVNYQGYPATTGLLAIDYRITDLLSDPPGMTDNHCVETLVRLPTTDWVYQPPSDAPEIAALPAGQGPTVTFGSLNYFGKLSDISLDSYMRILSALPHSRLLMKSKGLGSKGSRGRVQHFMDRHHIPAEQVEFIEWIPPAEHYRHFGRLDIALDSFPYHGTTTTCETLWMGVPVITLAGKSHVSRVGVSLLTNLGLPELVAETPEQFVRIAVEMAGNVPRLAELRATLRNRMRSSPLMDEINLAREMESAYRTMWGKWCEKAAVPVGG